METTAIERYLRTQPFWERAVVRDITPIGAGWESEIVGFDAELASRTMPLVVRMYTGLLGEAKALREGHGMQKLHAAGYPVPQVHLVEPDPQPLGLPFIIMDRVGTTTLGDHMRTTDDTEASVEFTDLLIALHRVDPDPFIAQAAEDDPHYLMRAMFAEWREIAGPTDATTATALDWFEAQLPGITPLPPAVTHNDFHPDNVLRDPNGDLRVIDWTSIAPADPRIDLAWTLLLREIYGSQTSMERIRDRYEAHLPVPDLEFFEAAARLRRLFSVAVSLAAGPESMGMRPEAAEHMAAELARSQGSYGRFVELTGQRLPLVEKLLEK